LQFTQARCPLCDGTSARQIVFRENVPVVQNRLYECATAARSAPVGTLDVVCCAGCGFIFNRAFRSEAVTYDPDYENDQTYSPYFTTHLAAMAERVLAHLQRSAPGQVIEVGCGQGAFLNVLHRAVPERGLVGFDPAWRGEVVPDSVRIERRHFDEGAVALLEGPVAAVISRHVIEHVASPVEFLKAIRFAVPENWAGKLFIETPCAEWIMENRASHDFIYEHCNYFTVPTLRAALARAGFGQSSIERVFQGQYLWAEATPSTVKSRCAQPNDAKVRERLIAAATDLPLAETGERLLVESLTKSGLAVWGAGAKGITFASNADPAGMLIRCLIDSNPRKQNRFVPKTAHLVVSAAEAKKRGVRVVIVMNPNYESEIRASILDADLNFDVVSCGRRDMLET
jgi:hypothetical protein